eukprot:Skav202375  [mRNA]  locus=scaffold1406:194945:200245:- [translate_table: standard]
MGNCVAECPALILKASFSRRNLPSSSCKLVKASPPEGSAASVEIFPPSSVLSASSSFCFFMGLSSPSFSGEACSPTGIGAWMTRGGTTKPTLAMLGKGKMPPRLTSGCVEGASGASCLS